MSERDVVNALKQAIQMYQYGQLSLSRKYIEWALKELVRIAEERKATQERKRRERDTP